MIILVSVEICASQSPAGHIPDITNTTPSATPREQNPERKFLPVTTAPPDPLGISAVSSFYGPGAWAGWFLTAVASYVRFLHKPLAKIDPNTWLFLLGTNWAAIDFFRNIHSLSGPGTIEQKEKGAGIIGASLSITFWGNMYALAQLGFVLKTSINHDVFYIQRVITLLIGVVLPSAAQTMALFMIEATSYRDTRNMYLGDVSFDRIPFVYMDNEFCGPIMELGLLSGWIILQFSVIALLGITWRYGCSHSRIRATMSLVRQLRVRLKTLVIVYLAAGLAGVLPTTILIYNDTKKPIWVWVLIIYGAPVIAPTELVVMVGLCHGWIICFMLTLLFYTITLCETRFRSLSEGCFFMPCAPQSIMEWDQAYALVVGIVLLVGVECVPAVAEHKKELRAFEKGVERKIADGLRRRRARNTSHENIDIALEGFARQNDEPDAPLPFPTENRATLFTSFAESEEDFGTFQSSEASSSIAQVGVGERYMMPGGRSGIGINNDGVNRDSEISSTVV